MHYELCVCGQKHIIIIMKTTVGRLSVLVKRHTCSIHQSFPPELYF